jgi:hypothetical protein
MVKWIGDRAGSGVVLRLVGLDLVLMVEYQPATLLKFHLVDGPARALFLLQGLWLLFYIGRVPEEFLQ